MILVLMYNKEDDETEGTYNQDFEEDVLMIVSIAEELKANLC